MYGTFVRHDPKHVDTRVFASTPNTRAKNVTGGVQDWSVGPLFPCIVSVVGNPHEEGSVRYVALDLHDATATFPGRESYSAAETDARQYLANIERHGGRERARMIANLHRANGGVSWGKVAGRRPLSPKLLASLGLERAALYRIVGDPVILEPAPFLRNRKPEPPPLAPNVTVHRLNGKRP